MGRLRSFYRSPRAGIRTDATNYPGEHPIRRGFVVHSVGSMPTPSIHALPEPSINAEFKAAAQSRYAELRALAPIHRGRILNGLPCWIVVDYELAKQALTHPALLKDDTPAGDTLDAHLAVRPAAGMGPNMLHADPPHHTRLRRLVAVAFTRPRVAALRPRVTEIAEELADGVAAVGQADLVQSYTSLLPVRVICELLGVREREQGQFRDWTKAALGLPSAEQQQGFVNLTQYLTGLVAEKRRAPADDLLSALVAVRDEHDGRLTEEELVGTANLLVIAGHDTTVNLLGNAMVALFDHPEQARLLRERPELIKDAVEEFLRFDPSVEYTPMRFAARDVELGGARIARGDIVVVSLTSASRSDPDLAAERDTLDVTHQPARHLAFGHGIHHCLGAPLARLETEIGIGTLLRRFPHLRPASSTAELDWIAEGMMHGPLSLPVSVTPPEDRT
jgi:cytochrome P450